MVANANAMESPQQDTADLSATWIYNGNECKLLRKQFRVDIDTEKHQRNISYFK